MEDTLKSWKMQRASSIPYPFETQRATQKMEDMADVFTYIIFYRLSQSKNKYIPL